MFAAGLLFGDGIITPAISVLSAVEGLKLITPAMSPWVVPLTVVILLAVFYFQRRGSARMGSVYGPVMLLWFGSIAALGAWQVYLYPSIIASVLNPFSALDLLTSLGARSLALFLGAVFLTLTGAEALYADLGHFGRRAIRVGWASIVFPALILNYAGQGAYLLRGGEVHGGNLFYSLVPGMFLIPMIIVATCATIIASVALIFGVYSLASQAVALSLLPRIRVVHTNAETHGQIYIPSINAALCIGSVTLVLVFESASRLAAAYGFAVSGVMVITSLAMIGISRHQWHWKRWHSLAVFGTFLIIDSGFFLANSVKFLQGGFVPFSLGVLIFCIIIIWRWGRHMVNVAYAAYVESRDMQWFLTLKRRLREAGGMLQEGNRTRRLAEQDRAVVFIIARPITKKTDSAPAKLRVYLKRKGVIPRSMLLLHIEQARTPFVKRHYKVFDLGEGVFSAQATFGFMENPDAVRVLRDLYRQNIFDKRFRRCTIETSEEEFIVDADVAWHVQVRLFLYKVLLESSMPAYRYFGLYAEAGAGLSKTVVPIRLSRNGVRVEIPEFPMLQEDDSIDPDTLKTTEVLFTKV
jgi:KUP system potassium uptake protein